MIEQGYVLVNDTLVRDPLVVVDESSNVSFSSAIQDYANTLGVVVFHKPRGVWTNCKVGDNQQQVTDLLPKKYRSYSSIGRLDKDSEGLILFTNDGVFANQYLNSGDAHDRLYRVWTHRPLTGAHVSQLRSGIRLSDGRTKPCTITPVGKSVYEFVLQEGKNRQIRRMIEHCGTHVTRLKRLEFGEYRLGDIPIGGFEYQSLADHFLKRLTCMNLPSKSY